MDVSMPAGAPVLTLVVETLRKLVEMSRRHRNEMHQQEALQVSVGSLPPGISEVELVDSTPSLSGYLDCWCPGRKRLVANVADCLRGPHSLEERPEDAGHEPVAGSPASGTAARAEAVPSATCALTAASQLP
jgi:hypothetical protein